ncbi:hypothetical protein AVEN_214159-1, partial [Araneus ventricosus]
VCELYFVEEDLIREARGFDMQTGKVLTAPLSIKKLKKDAFPSIFKGYPEYSCKIARNQRDDPQQKREAREQSAISQAIEASIKEKELYEMSRLFVSLKEFDLKFDEIHIKPYADYKSGSIVGISKNSGELATSAHVFMISSVTSYRDVVHVWPVKSIKYDDLHCMIRKIIDKLEHIGFIVFAVVSDNNSINRSAMSQFDTPVDSKKKKEFRMVYVHPSDKKRPLFYLIDSVHLIKCVRNNWLNQKNDVNSFFFPNFEGNGKKSFHQASFASLRKLHPVDSNNLVKHSCKLTLKALSPSSLETQNVSLALQVFNDNTVGALKEVGNRYEIEHFEDTAEFIRIILTWRKIMNVKSLTVGLRENDKFKQPLPYMANDEKVQFLKLVRKMGKYGL